MRRAVENVYNLLHNSETELAGSIPVRGGVGRGPARWPKVYGQPPSRQAAKPPSRQAAKPPSRQAISHWRSISHLSTDTHLLCMALLVLPGT